MSETIVQKFEGHPLPDGWIVESLPAHRGDYTVIHAGNPHGSYSGMITIDNDRRCYRLGYCTGRTAADGGGDRVYFGRGWRTRLVADAVAALQAAIGPRDAADKTA